MNRAYRSLVNIDEMEEEIIGFCMLLITAGTDVLPHARGMGEAFLTIGSKSHLQENLRMCRQ